MVEHNLAKVGVASSSLVFRSQSKTRLKVLYFESRFFVSILYLLPRDTLPPPPPPLDPLYPPPLDPLYPPPRLTPDPLKPPLLALEPLNPPLLILDPLDSP